MHRVEALLLADGTLQSPDSRHAGLSCVLCSVSWMYFTHREQVDAAQPGPCRFWSDVNPREALRPRHPQHLIRNTLRIMLILATWQPIARL